jgi:hypothetical protein
MTERRTLLVTERAVAEAERAAYVATLRATEARCRAQGVHFWAFSRADDETRFLEFAEAKAPERFEGLALETSGTSRWVAVELS